MATPGDARHVVEVILKMRDDTAAAAASAAANFKSLEEVLESSERKARQSADRISQSIKDIGISAEESRRRTEKGFINDEIFKGEDQLFRLNRKLEEQRAQLDRVADATAGVRKEYDNYKGALQQAENQIERVKVKQQALNEELQKGDASEARAQKLKDQLSKLSDQLNAATLEANAFRKEMDRVGSDEGIQQFNRLNEAIKRDSRSMTDLRLEVNKLGDALRTQLNPSKIEEAALKVENLARNLVKINADATRTDRERKAAQDRLIAAETQLGILKSKNLKFDEQGNVVLGKREAQYAKNVRLAAQEAEAAETVRKIRKDILDLSEKEGKAAFNTREVAEYQHRLGQLYESLKRLGVARKELNALEKEASGLRNVQRQILAEKELAAETRKRAKEAAEEARARKASEQEIARAVSDAEKRAAAEVRERQRARTQAETQARKELQEYERLLRKVADAQILFDEADRKGFRGKKRAEFEAQIVGLREELAKAEAVVNASDINLKVDAKLNLSDLIANLLAARAAADAAAGRGGGGGIIGLFKEVADGFNNSSNQIAAFDNYLRGLMTLGIVFFFNQLIVLAGAAAGALMALASSALFAAGAIGGGLVAGIGQALPMLGILIAAFTRVAAVMKAVQQANLLRQQQSAQGDRINKREADTADQIASAQEGVADAHRRVIETQRGLTEARREARRDLEDLILAEKEAALAARGASLSQEEAQDRLRAALSSGRTGDIARARLSVDEAGLGVDRAALRASRATEAATQGRAQGVEGSERVRRAKEQIADAERAAARAERGLERARRSANLAGEDSLAAAGKLSFLLGELSPAERKLYDAMRNIQKAFTDFAQKTTGPIIDSFTFMINRVADLLATPRIINAFTKLSTAIGGAITKIFDTLTSGDNLETWLFLVEEATKNIKPLTQIAIDFGEIFLNIARAAAPIWEDFLNWVTRLTHRFNDITSDQGKMGKFFALAGDHLSAWVSLAGAVGKLFLAIAGPGGGAAAGLNMVERMTGAINRMTERIERNPQGMRTFFRRVGEAIDAIMPVFRRLGEAFTQVFDGRGIGALKGFASIMNQVLIPAVVGFIRMIALLGIVLGKLVEIPLVGEMVTLGLQFILIAGLGAKLITLFTPLGILIGGVAAKIVGAGGLVPALKAAGAAMGGLLARVGQLLGRLPGLRGLGGMLGRFGRGGGDDPDGRGRTTGSRFGDVFQQRGHSPTKPLYVVDVGAGLPGGDRDRDRDRDRGRGGAVVAGGGGSRVGRIAAGAGIAAIGAGIASQAIPGLNVRNLRDIPDDSFFGRGRLAVDNLKKSVESLMSLDIGGFFKNISRDVGDFSEFGEHAEKNLSEMTKENNVKGLENLAKSARKHAEDWPEAADALGEFADRAQKAADRAKLMDERIGDLAQRFSRSFRRGGLKGEDFLGFDADKERSNLAQFLSNLNRMRQTTFRSVSEIRNHMRFNTRAIGESLTEGSHSWQIATARNFGEGIASIRRAMRDGTISTRDGMREIRRITREQMRFARDNMDKLSDEGKQALGNNMMKAADAAERQMKRAGRVTDEGMKRVRRMMVEGLKLYGFSEEEAVSYAKTMRQAKEADRFTELPAAARRATGGWVGLPGERGKDAVRTLLGRGEVVLNYAQQKVANAQLAAQGTSLHDIVRRVRGYHAGGPEQPGFAGGYAGKTPHGTMVEIPGQPGEFINKRIVRSVTQMMKTFKMAVTDGFATSGHAPGGDHPKGLGVDFVPGAGGNWNLVDRAAAFARGKLGQTFRWIGYDGVPNHGRGHHLHLSWLAKGAAALGIAMQKLRRLIVKGGGMVGGAVQGASDAAIAAANERLKQAYQSIGIEQGPGGYEAHPTGKNVLGEGAVRSVINRAMEVAGVPEAIRSAWASMSYRRARQESGFNPNAQNNWDSNAKAGDPSRGLFQTIGATFGAYSVPGMTNILNPLHNAVAAFRYMFARYGNGKSWSTALQRMLGREGIGYATGGVIPGDYDGAPQPILAHAGEWVLNKRQQLKIAEMVGANVGRLKSALGFTGGPTSFQGGGEVPGYIGLRRTAEDERHERRIALLKAQNRRDEIRDENRLHRERIKNIKEYEDAEKKRAARRSTEENRLRDIAAGIYRPPNLLPRNLSQVATETGRAFQAINRTGQSTGRIDRFRSNLGRLINEGGLFDTFAQAIERFTAQTSLALRQATLRFNRKTGQVKRVLDEGAVAEREIENLRELIEKSFGHEGDLQKALRSINARLRRVTARLAALRRGGITARERDEYNELETARDNLLSDRRNVIDRIQAEAERRQDAIDRIAEAQLQQFQRQTDELLKPTTRGLRNIELAERAFTAMGQSINAAMFGPARIAQMQEQFRILSGRVAAANAAGYTEYANQLQTQVEDLWIAILEAQRQAAEAALDAAVKGAQRPRQGLELQQRILQGLGQSDAAKGMNASILGWAEAELQTLRNIQWTALTQGNWDYADRLQPEIEALQVSIAEMTGRMVTDAMDAVNAQAERGLGAVGRAERLAGIRGQLGDSIGAAVANQRAGVQRTGILRDQRTGLQSILNAELLKPVTAQNTDAIKALREQIADLDVSIQESMATQKDLATATRQARIDLITRRGQFFGGIFGGLQSIAGTLGQISGNENTDVSKRLLNAQTSSMQQMQQGLAQQLFEEFKIDLRGKTGDQFVTAVEGMVGRFDSIMKGMTEAQRGQFENLINGLITNEGAIQQNTLALKSTTNSITQSFSSSAWQMFRQAIFTGSGGLLPGFKFPSMQTGGWAMTEGLYHLHPGEKVVPAGGAPGGDVYNINYSSPVEQADPGHLADVLSFRKSLAKAT